MREGIVHAGVYPRLLACLFVMSDINTHCFMSSSASNLNDTDRHSICDLVYIYIL